jgi:hypothetical protein
MDEHERRQSPLVKQAISVPSGAVTLVSVTR